MHHADTLGLQHVVDRVGDLRRHLLLDLQPLGVRLDDARELGDADDAPVGDIGDPGAPDDRGEVMLAVALEADAAQHDHLVVAFGLREGLGQDLLRVLVIAAKVFLVGARHARGRLDEAVAVGIVAGPADDGADRGLDLGAAGAGGLMRLFGFLLCFQGKACWWERLHAAAGAGTASYRHRASQRKTASADPSEPSNHRQQSFQKRLDEFREWGSRPSDVGI